MQFKILIPKHLKPGTHFQFMPPPSEHELYFNSDEIYEAYFISLIYCNIAQVLLEMIRGQVHFKSLLYTHKQNYWVLLSHPVKIQITEIKFPVKFFLSMNQQGLSSPYQIQDQMIRGR